LPRNINLLKSCNQLSTKTDIFCSRWTADKSKRFPMLLNKIMDLLRYFFYDLGTSEYSLQQLLQNNKSKTSINVRLKNITFPRLPSDPKITIHPTSFQKSASHPRFP
jgi:hypothetical protein